MSPAESTSRAYRYDMPPDTPDFRDRMYEPTLVEVPSHMDLDQYLAVGVPILDQGEEGSCTGFALATVAHYLLRKRKVDPDPTSVSPWMFYEMAKRYDEWDGVDYSGSSARGAMKGWHKHGICAAECWGEKPKSRRARLSEERARDAASRPLGAYYRVNHRDLVAMHGALAEVGVLYATAAVHEGWDRVPVSGLVPHRRTMQGGHAFAIVGFDDRGFWFQNSWGDDWGHRGFGLLTYDDWLENGWDVWVARLGAPVKLSRQRAQRGGRHVATGHAGTFADPELRRHLISIGNDGELRNRGPHGTTEEDVKEIIGNDIPRVTQDWKKKRILLYAHGGLTGEGPAVQRVAEYVQVLLQQEVYPLAFIWRTDYWTTLTNMLQDALRRRRTEGLLDAAGDFMLDRLDDALEPLARMLTGKAQWDEMKENAELATTRSSGGARLACRFLAELKKKDRDVELHVVGHSAGSIFHARIVELLTSQGRIRSKEFNNATGLDVDIASCTLWAPACTVKLFKETYVPAIAQERLGRLTLFNLTDAAERDDHCANVYHKSLLYLISGAFEEKPRVPMLREGEPLLGLDRFVSEDSELEELFQQPNVEKVLAPNTATETLTSHSTAKHHGDFDDDPPTLRATLARILGQRSVEAEFGFEPSVDSLRDRRRQLG